MPVLLIQLLTLTADLAIFIFIGYYLLKIRAKEQELEKKEGKIDTSYHQIVDNALTRERKILQDAASEADQIVTEAQYINQAFKQAIDQALAKIVADIQKEALNTARDFTDKYQGSLKDIAGQSLGDFQKVAKGLEVDLQKQIKDFSDNLLPGLEHELATYKQSRLAQIDQTIIRIVQNASQDILNKSISLSDHQNLVMESLEKAKKEGIFD